MGSIKALVIPVEEILDDILKTKPKDCKIRGGYIDIVIPDLCVAKSVVYDDPEQIIEVGRFKGRGVSFRPRFDNKDIYDVVLEHPTEFGIKENLAYVRNVCMRQIYEKAVKKVGGKKITYYWCLIVKSKKKGTQIEKWTIPTKKE